jgi:hypothetical protein
MYTLLLVLLILLIIGALPAWPHARPYGYAPASLLTVVLVVLLVLILVGGFPAWPRDPFWPR